MSSESGERLSRPFLSSRWSQHPLVQFLQPLELIQPLVDGQARESRHLHRAIQPITRLATREIEVSVAFRQLGTFAKRGEFFVDRLQRKSHGDCS